jgi:TATA-box binding protein (TBP) (component of TFIID and TFIIIB)
MASVARLVVEHTVAQRQHVERSRQCWLDMMDFSMAADLDPVDFKHEASVPPIRPWERWVLPQANQLSNDPVGTQNASHDVVPREVLLAQDPSSPFRCGTDFICAQVAAHLREQLDAHGLLERAKDPNAVLNESFYVDDERTMRVDVVNIVHTSYCVTPAEQDSKAIKMPSGMMWRRLSFLGCQENHIYTSLKISYVPPFKSVHLLFPPGRVLETGASNESVAHIMFFHATLQYLRATGFEHLSVLSRKSQNVVATSRLPAQRRLLLELLHHDHSDTVSYDPISFAGAVVKQSQENEKIMMLAFYLGAIVCVGAANLFNLGVTFETMTPILNLYLDTPENRQRLERFRPGALAQLPSADNPRSTGVKRKQMDKTETSVRRTKRPRIGGTHC